jgi:MFS transporter
LGTVPVLFADGGLTIEKIGILVAVYPAVWGAGQLVTGAVSDRIGRKLLITGGMLVQAAALAIIAVGQGFGIWLAGAVLLGAGTAMVYPTLLAAIGDVAHPQWRARSVGSTGSGATAVSPSVPCSPESSPTPRHTGRGHGSRCPVRGIRHRCGLADAQRRPQTTYMTARQARFGRQQEPLARQKPGHRQRKYLQNALCPECPEVKAKTPLRNAVPEAGLEPASSP